MSAVPVPDPLVEDSREQILLTGDLPSPANPPTGCRFHTRCPWRQETRCDTERPAAAGRRRARARPRSHRVACHFAEEIASGALQRHEVAPELVDGFTAGPAGPVAPPDAYIARDDAEPAASVGATRPSTRPCGEPRRPRAAAGSCRPWSGRTAWNEHQSHRRDGLGRQSPVSWARRIARPHRLDLALGGAAGRPRRARSGRSRRCRGRPAAAPTAPRRACARGRARRTSSGTAPWPRSPRRAPCRSCSRPP